ncbi:sarcosine oxidase subunit gamma [Amycolatopsis minnesotensis]|uniref:Sarcosine oxidase subunit gamma family protein n=1 Tax=Amycolatopsis minnesotensis TaxID=337894 RepID=A0ABP5D1X5_9PSEU
MTVSTLVRHSPLEDWAPRFAALEPAVVLAERPFLAQLTLRVAPGQHSAVSTALGCPLPERPCTATAGAGLDVLWLGPDEYLVLGAPGTESALLSLVDGLCRSAVDTSAQRTTVDLSGPHARDVLAHGCAVDLHPLSSPPGTCVQTLLARAGVVLVARGGDAFTVLVRSSFAGYLAAWLVDAATEYVGES